MTANGSDRTFLIPAGLAGVCVLLGFMLFAIGRHFDGVTDAVRAWPSTEGTVVTSALPTFERADREGPRRAFEYVYEVAGRRYTGSVIGWGNVDNGGVDTRVPVGTKLRVFYDPANPSNAALDVDVGPSTTPFFAIGVVMIVIGLPFAYLSYRMGRALRRTG